MNTQPDFVSLLLESADALQMPPEMLATIISYETGGTFSPTQPGPTTQFGQHRGLIQFGEPQAREYGVDWSNPLGSQLGRDGAVVRYFQRNGWQPGMSMLDAYSIVNAGGPGRYNASDANNGGAPGTVADKVRNQFGGHRDNARRLLAGKYDPAAFAAYNGPAAAAAPPGGASAGDGGAADRPAFLPPAAATPPAAFPGVGAAGFAPLFAPADTAPAQAPVSVESATAPDFVALLQELQAAMDEPRNRTQL